MTNYTFKGQVKVADVKAAFDDFINRINTLVSTYNTTETFLSNIDLTVGSPTLAAGGYTLTVGGIKQLLEAYDGVLLGCRAFRIDSTHIVVTDGIYFTSEAPYRIDAQVLSGDGSYIYFDPSSHTIGLVNSGAIPQGAIVIAELSPNSERIYLNEFRDIQLEGLDGYSITINKRSMSWSPEAINTSIARFEGGAVYQVNSTGAGTISVLGNPVATGVAENRASKRKHISAGPANFLYVPKGVTSPLSYDNANHVSITNYTFKLNTGNS